MVFDVVVVVAVAVVESLALFSPHWIKNIAGNYRFRNELECWALNDGILNGSTFFYLVLSMLRSSLVAYGIILAVKCLPFQLVIFLSVQMKILCFGFIPTLLSSQKYAEMKKLLAFAKCLRNNGQYQCLCDTYIYLFSDCRRASNRSRQIYFSNPVNETILE